MKVNSKYLWSIVVLAALVVSVYSEFRTWTDINGITLDAEYTKISGDQVYLKGRDGAETRVSRDYLCDKDILYVDLKNPPRVTINVNPDVSRRSIAAHRNTQIKRETVQCKVTITKKHQPPNPASLQFFLKNRGRGRWLADQHISVESKHTERVELSAEVKLRDAMEKLNIEELEKLDAFYTTVEARVIEEDQQETTDK